MDTTVDRLVDTIARLDGPGTTLLLEAAIATEGAATVSDALVRPALERIGDGWERGDLSIAHIYMGSRICERALDAHLPTAAAGAEGRSRLAIAVFEDRHMLGKRMVLSSLRASGYAVRDYGAGLTATEAVERVARDGVEVLLLSALMLRSALAIGDLVARLRRASLRTRVVVGGAPFRLDPRLADAVHADACGNNAGDALRIVRTLIGPPDRPRRPEGMVRP